MEVSLYFHIPFCKRKCPYCHFYVIPDKSIFKREFQEALILEWRWRMPMLIGAKIVSIYFGGGTPTLFAPDGIKTILEQIHTSGVELASDCEITCEANPEECTEHLFQQLHAIGVNRISLGVQSLDDCSLMILERSHSAKKAKDTIWQAYISNLQNISIDLMYDLPDQTEASWQYTLNQIRELPITHISLYNLTIEPHTSFYKRRNRLSLPDMDTSLRFLEMAVETFEQTGLTRYEISAFAKPGYQSRHNKGYWTGRPFLGFGPSAFSYWEQERFRNIAHFNHYVRLLRQKHSPVDFQEKLFYPANVKELLAIRLRLCEGIRLKDFPSLPPETKTTLEKWIAYGGLRQDNSMLHITSRGMQLYDEIASDII